MATHYSILAWKNPWTEEPGELQSKRSQRDAIENISLFFFFSKRDRSRGCMEEGPEITS